jgi:hypothetical protein
MLRAPFPWFGGKSRAAHLVWPRFGDVPNYVEPFAGSLAVLLARPEEFPPRVETVNDRDAYLSNFWRAVQADPDQVAYHADWPVNEADLHARHRWLVDTARERVERVMSDPEYFDAKVAGWWVWGQCLWIGSGWCARPEWTGRVNAGRRARGVHTDSHRQRPDLTNDGRGVLVEQFSRMGNVTEQHRRPQLSNDNGVHRKLPQFDRGGRGIVGPSIEREFGTLPRKRPGAMGNGEAGGVHSQAYVRRRPNMGGAGGGQGVQAPRLTKQQVPDLSGSRGATGRGIHATAFEVKSDGLYAYMRELQARLRRVRVCCGDWTRVVTPAVTTYIGLTGILLDPPYSQSERSICYSHDEDVSAAVREWAIANGHNPKLRIALCGYEGEHEMPEGWDVVAWKAGGGYGRSERGKTNRHRERIWFSPHCLADTRLPLLTEATA